MEALIFRPMGAAGIMNFGCSPSQKHGGFLLVIQDMILSHCTKSQVVTNFFYEKTSHYWATTEFYSKTRRSHRGCSVKKDVLRNFAKFTGKQLCQRLNFIKKESLAQVFSCEFCEISKNTFFTEHLRTTASRKRMET